MPRGLQALALRATLLAICTRVIGALIVGRQFEQTPIRKDSSWPDLALSGSNEEIEGDVDCDHIENKSAQAYILLGPMDTGTHLIHQLMYTAWPSKVCKESPSLVWKHALTGVKDIYHHLLDLVDRETLRKHVVLHTLRSPISLFASWRRKPYEMRKCVWSWAFRVLSNLFAIPTLSLTQMDAAMLLWRICCDDFLWCSKREPAIAAILDVWGQIGSPVAEEPCYCGSAMDSVSNCDSDFLVHSGLERCCGVAPTMHCQYGTRAFRHHLHAAHGVQQHHGTIPPVLAATWGVAWGRVV